MNTKKTFGGKSTGAKTSLFKPLIATSLALALNANVASADAPQITGNNGKIDFNSGVWETSGSYQQHTGDIIFTFVGSDMSGLQSTPTPLQTPNGSIYYKNKNKEWTTLSGYLIQQSGRVNGNDTVLGLTSNTSIKLVANPNANPGITQDATAGTIYFDFIQLVQPNNEQGWGQTGNDVSKDPLWGSADTMTPRKMVLNLENATDGQYSLEGNVVVDGGRAHKMYGENAFEATFGKSMKGDLTIQQNAANTEYLDIISKIVFLNGSNLEGNLTLNAGVDAAKIATIEGNHAPYAGNNIIFRKDNDGTVGGVTGGILKTTGGYSTLWYETNTIEIDNELDLRSGTLVLNAWKNIDTALKDTNISANSVTVSPDGYTISLDTSDSTRKTNDQETGQDKTDGAVRSKIDISGGSLVFDGFKQIAFNNSLDDGEGTLKITPQYEVNPKYKVGTDGLPLYPDISPVVTRQDGSVQFLFDSDLQTNSTIIEGNIDVERGSVIFQHKNAANASNLNGVNPFAPTPSIRGGGTISNTLETEYTINGTLTIKDGGLSTFWDDTKGFTAKIKANSISITGGLIGKNDIWITNSEDNNIELGTIDTIQATRGISHLVFESGLTVSGVDYEVSTGATENPLANAKNAIRTTQGLQLLVQGATTIEGDISVEGNGKNLLIFGGGATFQANTTTSDVPPTSSDTSDIRSATPADAPSIKLNNVGKGVQRNAYNTLVFAGATNTLTLKDIYLMGDWANGSANYQLNILSFNANANTNTLNASGGISTTFGNTIIAKNLYDATTMKYNEALFTTNDNGYLTKTDDFDTVFMGSSYQAQGDYTITGSITAGDNGKNFINVQNLTAGGISLNSYTSANFINVTKLVLTGDVTVNANSTNTINISGDSSNSIQNVIAQGGTNTITAVQLALVGIEASNSSNSKNMITVSGNEEVAVSENITANNGTNIIKASALNVAGAIISNTGGKSVNQISALEGELDLTVGTGIFARYGNSSNDINLGAGTLTLNGGAIASKDGVNTVVANTISINATAQMIPNENISTDGNGIYNRGGTNNITADIINITASGNGYGINSNGGTNNITTTTITFQSGSAISTSTGKITNLTINNNGALNATTRYNSKGSTLGLISTSGTLNLNLLGSATIKARFDSGGGTNNFNLGLSNGSNSENDGNKTITLITNKLGNNGKTTKFNFNQDDRTLALKGESGDNGTYTDYENATGHHVIVNFNANNGVFDINGQTLNLSSGNNEVNIADGASGSFQGKVTTTNTGTSTVDFASGGTTSKLTFATDNAEHSISNLTLTGESLKNTLDISAATKLSIANQVTIGESNKQELTINLKNTELALTTGLSTEESGSTTIVVNGADSGASATLSGGDISITKLDMNGTSGTLQTTLKANSTTIDTLEINNSATSNKLIVDASGATDEGIIGTIKKIEGNSLDVELKGDTNKVATLAINGENETIKSIKVTNGDETQNIFSLISGNTVITSKIDQTSVEATKGLDIQFNGDAGLNVVAGIDNSTDGGTINLSAKSGSSHISGEEIKASTLDIASGASLAVRNANATFDNASGSGTLTLDGANANAGVKVTVTSTIDTSNLTANFNGTTAHQTELVLGNGGTLKAVTLGENSTNNKVTLSNGTTTITDMINATQGSEITFDLANNTTLGLNGGASSKLTTSDTKGSIAITLQDAANMSATLQGDGIDNTETINITKLDFAGSSNAQTLKVANADIHFGTINANNSAGSNLTLDASSNTVNTTLHTISGDNLKVNLEGSGNEHTATLTLDNISGSINTLTAKGEHNTLSIKGSANIETLSADSTSNGTLTLNSGNAVITTKLDGNNEAGGKLNLIIDNATLSIANNADNKLASLTSSTNALVDLAITDNNGRPRAGRAQRSLEIGGADLDGFKGNATFEVYVGGNQADSVTFKSAQMQDTNKSVATIVASGDVNTILNGNGTLKVATVDNSAKNSMDIIGGEKLIGGVIIETVLDPKVGDNSDATDYYLGKGVDKGAPIQYQEVASSALTVNYDLYLANFNSLNKRMGELRDDANNNGVWARVFGGAMSNDFGSGSKTEYITAQAGYDYALSVGNNARNHLGIALAYGSSNTQGNTLSMNGLLGASGSISLNEVDSHMVEVGIYNTFISDSGWYNDTIFKFDYIMSKFSLSNKTDLFTDTSNFAMVLSDEFGYRYKFGENEKGSWYIDPQLEMAFGYFNQSDFNRAMYDASGVYQSTMQATQDTILTLRTRVGASLGKKFNTDKGFASLYVGAFYEYDYIDGGNASVAGRVGGTTTSLDSLESNGRAMLNVGSNIELTKGARLYIDVEKSFGDKQRTFMQFNLGARYSF